MQTHLSRRWQDGAILLLGLWLVISPWAFGYSNESAPAINAIIAGAIMAVLAAFDLYKTYVWAVLLNIAIGIWVAISPWLLQTMPDTPMGASMLMVGVATIVLGVWEMLRDPELHSQWRRTGTT